MDVHSNAAYNHAIELIGQRWTADILNAMVQVGRRHRDIVAAVPNLSGRVLSRRLKELTAEGLIERTVFPSMPVLVEYSLTDRGRTLQAIIASIVDWSQAWTPPAVEDDLDLPNETDLPASENVADA